MELLFVSIILIALSFRIKSCGGTDLCSSIYGTVGLNKHGAFEFPVFHRKHPCVHSSIHPANLAEGASPVIGNDAIHKGKFFMAISLGTPPARSLVTIDTGSTLSWVVCQPCEIYCHLLAPEAGSVFDPRNSTTYQRVGCSSSDCVAVQDSLNAPFGCDEVTDTCLYSLTYGALGPMAQYSAGKLGKDKLTLASGGGSGDSAAAVDGFVFGCSEDGRFQGHESGVIGFGDESFSFFNQVARQTSRNAFSYCFPGDHGTEGFLSIGPYAMDSLVFTRLIVQDGGIHHYLQQIDMMVGGNRLDVHPSEYSQRLMVVDSGTEDTFLLAPVYDAFHRAMTSAMRAKGFATGSPAGCFRPIGGPVNWRDLPTVEMKFTGTTLKLPPENVFRRSSGGYLCLAFYSDVQGVKGVQILGNEATRSFRVVHDLQTRFFGFQADAC